MHFLVIASIMGEKKGPVNLFCIGDEAEDLRLHIFIVGKIEPSPGVLG